MKTLSYPHTASLVSTLTACEYFLMKEGEDSVALVHAVGWALSQIGREEPLENEVFGPKACESAFRALVAMYMYLGRNIGTDELRKNVDFFLHMETEMS